MHTFSSTLRLKTLQTSFLLLLAHMVQAQVTVNSGLSPEQYVNDILLGSGIEATNIQYTGSPLQIGYISGFDIEEFPIEEGLILSSEVANNPANVNSGCIDDMIQDGRRSAGIRTCSKSPTAFRRS